MGKRIGRAQSISLFSLFHVCVFVCEGESVMSEDALLFVSSELFLSGQNCELSVFLRG